MNKRPMLKAHRGGKSKKLPSMGPHPKREPLPLEPTFSLGLTELEGPKDFFVLDSLGDTSGKPVLTREWALKAAKVSAQEERDADLVVQAGYNPYGRHGFHPVSAEDLEYLRGLPAPLRITVPVTIEPEGRVLGEMTYDNEGMGARVAHPPPCPECWPSNSCDTCSDPAEYLIPGIPHEADMKLCGKHAEMLGMACPSFELDKKEARK